MRDPKKLKATIEFYSRHLVALCVAFKMRSEGANAREQFRANCGFLLSVRNKTFFVTAGHILDTWNEGFERSDIEVVGSWFWSSFGGESTGMPAIPFDLKNSKQILLLDVDRGLDYGAIELSDFYISELVANKVVVIGDEGLPSIDEQFDSFVLVGLPTEFTVWDMQQVKATPTVMGLSRAKLPFDRRDTEFPEFAGQLGENFGFNSMDGMSGGYVLGLRKQNGETRYWPFAIQSRWRPSEGLVFACSIRNFAEQIAIEVDKVDTELYRTRSGLSQG